MRELAIVLGLLLVGVAATAEQPAGPGPQLDVLPLPERKPPKPRQDTTKVDVLEARLADVIRRANDQERTMFRLGFLVEDLLGRVQKLEAAQKTRRLPRGLRYFPPYQHTDGSWSGDRYELIWATPEPEEP